MINERIRDLFAGFDKDLKAVIMDVLRVEQEHISMKRPRVKDQINEIITRVAEKGLGQ